MDWYPRKTQLYRNKTWHLSLAEHGAYTLLIDYYYTSESPLPNNDNALASIIGCSLDDWLAVRENVTRYFTVSNGMLTHETCDEVLEDQLSKRKDGASRVAKYRARKNKTNVTRDKPVSNASRGEERKGKETEDIGAPKAAPKPKRGTRLPEEWVLPLEWKEWAEQNGCANPQATADCFRDYWIGVSGAKGVKNDWPATWRNWVRREHKQPRSGGGNQQHTGFAAQVANGMKGQRHE